MLIKIVMLGKELENVIIVYQFANIEIYMNIFFCKRLSSDFDEIGFLNE